MQITTRNLESTLSLISTGLAQETVRSSLRRLTEAASRGFDVAKTFAADASRCDWTPGWREGSLREMIQVCEAALTQDFDQHLTQAEKSDAMIARELIEFVRALQIGHQQKPAISRSN